MIEIEISCECGDVLNIIDTTYGKNKVQLKVEKCESCADANRLFLSWSKTKGCKQNDS